MRQEIKVRTTSCFLLSSTTASLFHVPKRSFKRGGVSRACAVRTCPFRLPAVIFITPPGITSLTARDPSRVTHLAVSCAKAGVAAIQLRDPLCVSDQDFLETYKLFENALKEADLAIPRPLLIANGGPYPTHFPERRIDKLKRARDQIGDSQVLGCSVHSVIAAKKALAAGASYLQVGTMFRTRSHPGKDPEGIELMKAVRSDVGEEAVLIGVGGINAGNARSVVEAGANGVAVISGIACAKDPHTAVRELIRAVETPRSSSPPT